jgi:hypothetical protein
MLVYFEKQPHYSTYQTNSKCIRAFKSIGYLCLLRVSVKCLFFKVSLNLSVLFTSLTSIFYIYNKAALFWGHLGDVMLACLCVVHVCV